MSLITLLLWFWKYGLRCVPLLSKHNMWLMNMNLWCCLVPLTPNGPGSVILWIAALSGRMNTESMLCRVQTLEFYAICRTIREYEAISQQKGCWAWQCVDHQQLLCILSSSCCLFSAIYFLLHCRINPIVSLTVPALFLFYFILSFPSLPTTYLHLAHWVNQYSTWHFVILLQCGQNIVLFLRV